MLAAGGADITIAKNAFLLQEQCYLFGFVSNESQGSVYFDDLTACPEPVEWVTHTPGPLLEACPDEGGKHHYYPTGLEMFALSSSAANGHVRNRYTYQGQERENTFALNLNEFEARHYDGQLGRWMVPDPANQFASPYVGMGNEWVSGVDPDGRWVNILAAAITNIVANRDQIRDATEGENGSAWRGIGMALGYGAVGALGAWTGGKLTKVFDLSSTFSQLVGFGAGGTLNVGFEGMTNQFSGDHIKKSGRILGSFLTGGFSVLAGNNIGESIKEGSNLGFKKHGFGNGKIAKPVEGVRGALSTSELDEFGKLASKQVQKKAIFGKYKGLKYGLAGLENLGSKLNYYDGHLELGQAGVFFGAGVSFGLTSYALSRVGVETPRLFESQGGFGFTSVVSPLLSYGFADMASNFLNYYGSYNSWKVTMGDLYTIGWKSGFKVFSYTGSSFWGFIRTNNGFR
jgi:RHS repeat-associated protein